MSTVTAAIATQPTVTKEEATSGDPKEPPEGLDHSCFVTIWNNTDHQLQLTGSKSYEGKFASGPTQMIDRLGSGNNKGFIKMEKNFGFLGSKGDVWYSTPDGQHQFKLGFGCPASDNNYASGSPNEGSPKAVTGPFDARGDLVVSFSVIN